MSTAVVLRIKFPQTYPIIYKTVRLNSTLKVSEALGTIAEQVHVEAAPNAGLFLPEQKMWLDNERTLAEYPQLTEGGLEYIEYKVKGSEKRGCTIL